MRKTNRSLTKRIKVTSSGKLLRRHSRQNHFNAKARRVNQLRGKLGKNIERAFDRKAREWLHV